MLYGAAVWDPLLIIAQIISVQCLFYLSLGLWQALFLGPYVNRLTVAHIFNWTTMNFHNYVGWMSILSNLINAPLGAIYLTWIVERAKKCLDFASTCYMFHLIFCWAYSGIPASIEWWTTNSIALLIMSLLGEWLCVRREMADIPLNTLRSRGASAGGAPPGAPSASMQMTSMGGSSSRSQLTRATSKDPLINSPV